MNEMSEERCALYKLVYRSNDMLYNIIQDLSAKAYPLSAKPDNSYKMQLDYAIKAIDLARTILLDFNIE